MKPSKTPFSYVVLRYMHDVFTREFVNVGLLLFAPQCGFMEFKRLANLNRVRALFPGADTNSLMESPLFFESRTQEFSKTIPRKHSENILSADTIARALLPADDSSLQWSPSGGGVTLLPETTLNELFERLVTRHLQCI